MARSVTEVGKGDFIKVGSQWKKIESNSAEGSSTIPRNWEVKTEDGMSYSMWNIKRYAKEGDPR